MRTWHRDPKAGVPRGLLVYTDGSAQGNHAPMSASEHDILPAAWAFAVWAQCDGGLFFLGASSYATTPPDTPFHLGEAADDSLTAELLGLAWALVWALEHGAKFQVPIEFRYDSTSAGGGVFGTQRLPQASLTAPPILAQFVAQLRLTLTQRVEVRHSHVKGHSGEPGNELCDIMSKCSRHCTVGPYERCLPTWPHQWLKHEFWQWGWLAHHSSPVYPALPALEAEAKRLQTQIPEPIPPSLGLETRTPPRFLTTSRPQLTMSSPFLTLGQLRGGGAGALIPAL